MQYALVIDTEPNQDGIVSQHSGIMFMQSQIWWRTNWIEVGSNSREKGAQTLDAIDVVVWSRAGLGKTNVILKMSHPCPAILACPFYTDVDPGYVTTNHSGLKTEKNDTPFQIQTFYTEREVQ